MKSNRGFSLLELLIVVAIILIIATIAIPSLLRSRQAAQESSAVAQLRTINTAEVTYLSSNQGAYGSIPELITAGLLDNRFTGSVSGYNFTVTASASSYTASATPTSTNAGRYGYFALPDAVVRWADATLQAANSANCSPCYPTNQSGNAVQ
jgi:prepilin-type N-terminal cleavage/methylation domain-containing protein